MAGNIETKRGNYAFGPYVNYDSTYSWTFGAAIIKESEDKKVDTFHLDFEGSTKGYQEIDFKYHKMLSPKIDSIFEFDYDTFFSPFYGEGISSKVSDKKLIDQRQITIKGSFFKEITQALSVGPVIEFDSRRERPLAQLDKRRFYPDDESGLIGSEMNYDTRDSKLDPYMGTNINFALTLAPNFLDSVKDQSSFSQVKLDCRKYTPFYNTVFASRFAIGETLGRPNYLHIFKIGGPDFMRGYEVNRFVGNQFAVVQLEERIKLIKDFLAGTISYEEGTVTSKLYDKRRSNWGVGLRVAMPPDWRDKLSVNFGFGDDQNNIEMEFNENF
jgi:hypothetical protein